MALKTKSIYDPVENIDGLRVLVTRYYPRGIKKSHFDCWLRDLSPSKELLSSYRDGSITWDGFKAQFLAELQDSNVSRDAISFLKHHSDIENVTLLCYERAGKPCHRYIIRDLIRDTERLFQR